jgi:signal transduction histidine kinase
MKPSSIVACIVACVVALGATALRDEQREAAAGLADFGQEQAALARQFAAAVRAATRGNVDLPTAPAVRDAFASVEQPGEVVAVLRSSHALAEGLQVSSGASVPLPRLESALDDGGCAMEAPRRSRCSLVLSHDESVALGLPPRMGIAGVASFVADNGTRWGVAVVAGAARERDRERRASARTVLSFLVSSGLVLAFGMLALRKQRRELALATELAVKDAVRARDERLVRADKLATMGALATGVAHEVSTPLGIILGRAEQLAPKVAGDARAGRAVSAIVEQAERIKEIIRAFLALARGASPSLEQADPQSIAQAAVDLVEHRFAEAGVSISSVAREPLPMIACNPQLLEQALVNLLLNACDACAPGGSVAVDVRVDDGQVAFVVTDDGAGITAEAAARATEPFFTTKPEGHGTGLGLAIACEIVQRHRGTLTVRARLRERGTEARINVPPVQTASTAVVARSA